MAAKLRRSVRCSLSQSECLSTCPSTTVPDCILHCTVCIQEIRAINKAMKIGGRVLLRSAGLKPWYIAKFSAQGFRCERVAARTAGKCIDR